MPDRNEVTELITRYPELKDAVRVAMMKALRAGSDGAEWGGAIFQRGNEFYASDPQSSKQTGDIKVRVVPDAPDDSPAAIYHTHPRGPDSQRFSPNDVNEARKLKMPSFIGLTETGDVRVFDPGVDRPDPANMRDPTKGAARGRTYLLAEALRMAQK